MARVEKTFCENKKLWSSNWYVLFYYLLSFAYLYDGIMDNTLQAYEVRGFWIEKKKQERYFPVCKDLLKVH